MALPEISRLLLRRHNPSAAPVLLHLPGLHGDWNLLGPFRHAIAGRAQLIDTTYPPRPAWSLPDYVLALETALLELGVQQCWLLAESFASQVAWQFLARTLPSTSSAAQAVCVRVQGLILVGGFVRHPWPWGVTLASLASSRVPPPLLRLACQSYARLARRQGAEPEFRRELQEFVDRRSQPLDRIAITARYRLIREFDPRSIARQVTLPVFQLSGGLDPIVPWSPVRRWLRQNCPGYVASRILPSAGHNILLSRPQTCADQILGWSG